MGATTTWESTSADELQTSSDCPLSVSDQTRNLLLYSITVGLEYLAAPILYVGIVQAALCERLHATRTVANLPASITLWTMPVAVVVAWRFPYVRLLRPLLVGSFAALALSGVLVVLALLLPTTAWVIPALLVHAAVVGYALSVVGALQWEILGRGLTMARRSQAFALAFGVGPLLAVAGSLGAQLVLSGNLGTLTMPRLDFPANFALLFAATVPLTALAALLSSHFVVPQPKQEVPRLPFFSGVLGGLREFLGDRMVLATVIAYIAAYAGLQVMPSVTLFTQEALGAAADQYIGYQDTLRFGFKVVAGLLLGWLLACTHPKAGLLATAILTLVGAVWPLLPLGPAFLLSFGFLGAGELMGVYFPNYLLCCSAQSQMRRNMAFVNVINMPVSLAPLLFGTISDRWGLRWSFRMGVILEIIAIMVVLFCLPSRPQPTESE